MRYILTVGSFLFLLFIPLSGDEIDDLYRRPDIQKLNSRNGALSMLNQYAMTINGSSNSYELSWQYAALNYFYATHYVDKPSDRKVYFTRCKDYAWKAVKLNPEGVAGHYWLGVGYAKWSEANGILRSLFYADDVEREMSWVIKKQPDFFRGIPWAVRATVYAFTPSPPISVGSKDKALVDIDQAMAYGKDYRMTCQIVASVLIKLEQWDKAQEYINKGLAFPFDNTRMTEEEDSISELEKMAAIVKQKTCSGKNQ